MSSTFSPSSTSAATTNANAISCRVMTFNIRGAFHRQDGANMWPHRRALHLDTIQKYDPDIIGFQEVQSGNFHDYNDESCFLAQKYEHVVGHACKRSMHWTKEDLQERWTHAPGTFSALGGIYGYISNNIGASSQHDEYLPIYWKKERFAKVQDGAFYMSETPTVESIGWESKLIRAATWVWLREIQSGAECIVVNTHFPHEKHDPTRTECACVILQQLSMISTTTISSNNEASGDCTCIPHIVLGDFNCHASRQTEAYATFLENGYEDTFKTPGDTARNPALNTFHHFMGDKCPWNLGRIDWILIKNQPTEGDTSQELPNKSASTRIESPQTAQIIRDAEPPLYPSDHYPIVANLELHKC